MYRRGGRNAFPFLLFLGGESMAIKIERVEAGSEAEALGLLPGDELLAVDQNELNDTLDYDFYTDSKSFHLKARVADGIREWDVQRAEVNIEIKITGINIATFKHKYGNIVCVTKMKIDTLFMSFTIESKSLALSSLKMSNGSFCS